MAISELRLNHAAFDMWLMSERSDNLVELERVKRIVPLVLEECCTSKQEKYIMHYFGDGMTIPEIANMYGVNKGTVSRVIHRGLKNAYKYLRFVSPLFIHAPQKRGYLRAEWRKDDG